MMQIGKLEAMHRLTVARRLCDQFSMGPSGVTDQSIDRISDTISPSPIGKESPTDSG